MTISELVAILQALPDQNRRRLGHKGRFYGHGLDLVEISD